MNNYSIRAICILALAAFLLPAPGAHAVELTFRVHMSYQIQLGAFDSEENARTILQRLQDAGYDARIIPQETRSSGTRYLVRQLGIESKASAEQLVQEIFEGLGINGFIVPPSD